MKARLGRRAAGATIGAALFALVAGPLPAAGAAEQTEQTGQTGQIEQAGQADGKNGLVMVLDSSGSMADDDGTGQTRMESARAAVGTVVDALPDGFPTGLRVYGADQPKGCTDTRLALPVQPLDRTGMKQAVGAVQPKGDTPIGLSLQKAAQDLPRPADGAIGTRTILLISDGEDNCGTPQPCEVAEQLAKDGIGLRIDTVGFQVRGAARQQLECIARAGNGRYYDAPDAKALARQLQRSAQLSADGYLFRGKPVEGARTRDTAPALLPGQYLDTIGPGEKRYYATDLDGVSTVDFSATAVPQPGAAVDTFDVLRTSIAYGTDSSCESSSEHFFQKEGATPLTSAVARIPSAKGTGSCDKAGRYWLVVERESKPGSDAARWPLELTYTVEQPLAKDVTPAQSQPEYGRGDKEAPLPTGDPRDVTGGTGFNDAKEIGHGVWRDKVLPSQTLWYKVPVGWGQQLRYDVEFANEPTVDGASSVWSYGATQVFTPARAPVGGGTGEFGPQTIYNGRPMALEMGTVPVAWTNRHEHHPNVVPVHTTGGFYIAVTLGAKAAEIAENPQIGVVLRVAVIGDELAGPQHDAPALAKKADNKGDSAARADSEAAAGAGWSGTATAAAVGGAVIVIAGLVLVLVRRRSGTGPARGPATDTTTTRRSA
ncbi:VWA domain-containing protein [Streptomyces sp. NBC_01142]|uniref:vWA domain-containing protein n=1 Tax=Streptomyces sp. NBC_01142 TaxID=2975865 RepID=UPI00225310F7|nr:VWA domain-containing protein [Streptomyces sp. NBC_01142]MCX4824409.1 VWA domain-containing protein [Streptomyces sp. NBC_01142]